MNGAMRGEAATGGNRMQGRSVAGIARQNGLFFIARRKNDDTEMSRRWEFPGGKVEFEETDERALEREFMEEFSAPIKVIRFLGESVFLHRGKARALAAWEIALAPESVEALNEHSEAAWMPLDNIAELDLADSDKSLIPIIEAKIHGES